MQDRNNTIAGWILFALIVSLGAWIITGEIYHGEEVEHGGYALAGGEEDGAADEAAKPIEYYLASADVAKGEQVFKKCAACHAIAPGGANGIGPNLWGTVGAPIGKGHGFAFSEVLAGKGGTWDWKALDDWLASPRAFAPGTKMTFAGLGSPEDRANVIAYLNANGTNLPLPAAPAEATPAEGEEPAAEGAESADGNSAAPATP